MLWTGLYVLDAMSMMADQCISSGMVSSVRSVAKLDMSFVIALQPWLSSVCANITQINSDICIVFGFDKLDLELIPSTAECPPKYEVADLLMLRERKYGPFPRFCYSMKRFSLVHTKSTMVSLLTTHLN